MLTYLMFQASCPSKKILAEALIRHYERLGTEANLILCPAPNVTSWKEIAALPVQAHPMPSNCFGVSCRTEVLKEVDGLAAK